MLEATPNRSTPVSLRKGNTGWPVYALQTGLQPLEINIAADGIFGQITDDAVRYFQDRESLAAVDGIAGQVTQSTVTVRCEHVIAGRVEGLPVGLVRGIAALESAGYLGAVNWTIVGGVDCGVVQRRVYGPPYGLTALRHAFAPVTAMAAAADELGLRYRRFRGYGRRAEWSWRLAALAHNWPWAAEQLARWEALPNPNGTASWVPDGVRFPDGQPVRTRIEWCQFYALGGRHGEGATTRFVTSWT